MLAQSAISLRGTDPKNHGVSATKADLENINFQPFYAVSIVRTAIAFIQQWHDLFRLISPSRRRHYLLTPAHLLLSTCDWHGALVPALQSLVTSPQSQIVDCCVRHVHHTAEIDRHVSSSHPTYTLSLTTDPSSSVPAPIPPSAAVADQKPTEQHWSAVRYVLIVHFFAIDRHVSSSHPTHKPSPTTNPSSSIPAPIPPSAAVADHQPTEQHWNAVRYVLIVHFSLLQPFHQNLINLFQI